MMDILKKIRSAYENVSTAIQIVAKRWDVLLIGVLPPFIVLLFLQYVTDGQLSQVFQYAVGLVTPVATAVAAVVVDEETHGEATVERVFDRLRGRWTALIATSFIQSILTMIGFALLVVPGIFIAAWTFAAPIVLVLERDTDIIGALRRSRELATDQVGHIWGTLILAWLTIGLTSLLLRIAVSPIATLLHIHGPGLQFLYGVGYAALQSFIGVATALLYFDVRTRYTLERYPAMPTSSITRGTNVPS